MESAHLIQREGRTGNLRPLKKKGLESRNKKEEKKTDSCIAAAVDKACRLV
jgi:hypothetical protein